MANERNTIRRIAEESQTWAVVGLSANRHRPSHGVAEFLLQMGYRVIPINPQAGCEEILGQPCYPDLASVPEAIDVVDIFRRSEFAGAHIDEAIAVGARAVWTQLGVVDREAAARAEEAGLLVVLDRCPKIEFPALGLRPTG
jgi:predicted CoA-binding protein